VDDVIEGLDKFIHFLSRLVVVVLFWPNEKLLNSGEVDLDFHGHCDRIEKQLISAFVARIADLNPQLVTFNGNSFDLPVLRYRAMINSISAPGLAARSYFNRYTEDALDLCDALSSFSPGARATLNEISRIMGMPGKPDGIDGGQVEKYFREGKIKEIAEYCETDVLNTYRVWLRYELFRGRLTETTHQASELMSSSSGTRTQSGT
jgi:predicted PolB exonuclease-like 3'-5' exonuclease